jgi:hypothetical protein
MVLSEYDHPTNPKLPNNNVDYILILGIYANLALHVKLYDDLCEKKEQLLATGKWSNILKIWDGITARLIWQKW